MIKVPNSAKTTKILLRDAFHAPDLALTIVSVGRIIDAGYSVEFNTNTKMCYFRKADSTVIGNIPKGVNGLFKLDHAMAAVTEDKPIEIQSLHRKLGHISFDAIRALFRANSIAGVRLVDHSLSSLCDSCEHTKMMRKLICKDREAAPAQAFGEEIPQTYGGHRPMKALENANTM
jgi:hypothetical protein